ncbi:hypothetical protein [Bradyrhizobium sp. ARR65]|uniref:hypothetical protein n=1 Tax=Bradyrhizobium sp. ARR65 TaxID=1040989 RepID=UPI0004633E97|nr:hypothetical protein [Bradyrhizobium sp. ARR65]
MSVVASASAQPGHSALAVFDGSGLTLAIVGRDGGEGEALDRAYDMPGVHFLIIRETIDEW